MAGSYPDVPAPRMLLDKDGTTLHTLKGGARDDLYPSDLVTLCNEDLDDLGSTTDVEAYLLAFPDKRDIAGAYLGFVQDDPNEWVDVVVSVSGDTTTGLDGTWSTIYASSRVQEGAVSGWWGHTAPGDYRRYIRAISPVTAVRALRIAVTPKTPGTTVWRLASVHLYGDFSAGELPHRLEVWDASADARVGGGYFDWGNVPLGSSAEKQFRLHNRSDRKRATAVRVLLDALTDAVPSVPAEHLLSYAGSAYAASVTIPAIDPGATSGPITLRRVTPSTAAPGPWTARILTATTDWIET